MMPVSYSEDLRWRVIWLVYILQHSLAEASFFLCVCERTVERYISKFLVNGYVKPEPVGRSFDSINFAPREELIDYAYQIWKSQFLSVVQSLLGNCHSQFSPTTFFEISVYGSAQNISYIMDDPVDRRKLGFLIPLNNS